MRVYNNVLMLDVCDLKHNLVYKKCKLLIFKVNYMYLW